jgi:hypothetical protein
MSASSTVEMHNRRHFLIALLSTAGAFLTGCGNHVISATSAPASQRAQVRILFIGNSYTAYNGGMYRLLPEMARQQGRSVECVGSVSGGKSLEWHWNEGKAIELIDQGGWDWVVLQDYSTQPLLKRDLMFEYARLFHERIKASGARTAFYLTWARQHQPENQGIITDAYTTLARELGATVVPCGIAWEQALKQSPDLKLHRSDRSHPTADGTYLNVCCFCATLLKGDPRGLPPMTIKEEGQPPRALDAATTSLLQRIAWEATYPAPRAAPVAP